MFVGAGMPSMLGPSPKTNVRKYPGKEGKARKAIARGAPATITAPEITVMTPAHTALVTDVFILSLKRFCVYPCDAQKISSSPSRSSRPSTARRSPTARPAIGTPASGRCRLDR